MVESHVPDKPWFGLRFLAGSNKAKNLTKDLYSMMQTFRQCKRSAFAQAGTMEILYGCEKLYRTSSDATGSVA